MGFVIPQSRLEQHLYHVATVRSPGLATEQLWNWKNGNGEMGKSQKNETFLLS